MRFVITGTAGFIGNNLALKLLAEGHTVFGVDAVTDYYDVQLKRDRLALCEAYDAFTACEIRLEDYDALSKVFDDCTPDVVIHLAAQAGVRYSLDHPREYVDTNVIGSFNITELSKIHAVKHLIIASTSSAYGGKPASERDSLSPVAPYRLVNIGNGEPVELMDYIDAIETSIGRPANKNMIDMQPGDVKQTYANSDLLFDLTGYRPSTDYREGIAKFVAWYKEYYAGR